jgi:hypothetical protein
LTVIVGVTVWKPSGIGLTAGASMVMAMVVFPW